MQLLGWNTETLLIIASKENKTDLDKNNTFCSVICYSMKSKNQALAFIHISLMTLRNVSRITILIARPSYMLRGPIHYTSSTFL